MLKITALGNWASYGLKGKKHFSLLIERKNKRIWIDPAVKFDEPVDFILVSSPDEDHWLYLERYLKKFPKTPVYALESIASDLRLYLPDFKKNIRSVVRPLKLSGLPIKFMSIPEMVGKPASGFKLGSGKKAIVIIPEFQKLGKDEKELMQGTIWIIGVGEYEKPKSKDHKATFKELMEIADELKPKAIYLTNYRSSLLRHKRKVESELAKFNGRLLKDGDTLEFNLRELSIMKTDGLYLVKPHAGLIDIGAKSIVLKQRKFDITNKEFVLCDNEYAYGNIILSEPFTIDTDEKFLRFAPEHLVSKQEFEKWNWQLPIYAYRVKEYHPFREKKRLKLPVGIQTFVKDIEQYYITQKLHLDEFRSEGVDYDIKNPKEHWKELIADLRYLGNSGYPRLSAGKEWGDWTLTDVFRYFAKIVDALRSVYFPIIPPSKPKLYEEYYGKSAAKAKKSSFWKCYEKSKPYMKSKPPKNINEAREWDKKRKSIIKKSIAKYTLKQIYSGDAIKYNLSIFEKRLPYISILTKQCPLRHSQICDVSYELNPLWFDYSGLIHKDITNSVNGVASLEAIHNCFVDETSVIQSAYELKDVLIKLNHDTFEIEAIEKTSLKPGYYSKAKPYYRMYLNEIEDNIKAIGWDEKKLLVDCKWDGLRMTVGKINGQGFAFVDPENLKEKSPNVSKRIPAIIKEMEKSFPDNTILDAEFLALHPNKKEMLHRTDANSILNSNMSGKELEDYAIIAVFDVLFYDGLDIRDQPLHERLEYLSRLKETKHIWIERISTKFPAKADGFIINGSQASIIPKIAEYLRHAKSGRPKFCAEGVMIKCLDGIYEYPQNHSWAKCKFYSEIDLRVIDKKKVKGTKNVYNYYLGYDTPRDYAKAYLSMTTKDWYGKVYAFKNGKVIANGKDCLDYLDDKGVIFVTKMGKSDNAKEKVPVKIGDILRIAAEEVLKFDNDKFPEYPRYSFYIGRVLEPIPEKHVTDGINVIDKLSSFEPQRIPLEELRHIKESDVSIMKDEDGNYARIIRIR